MEIIETKLRGCFILQPKIFEDNRGYFVETYNQKKIDDVIGLKLNFIQDNESMSSKGVLRGLHYQTGKYAQAKLVRVTKGSVLDVVVDIRSDSKTFGEHISLELTEQNKTQLFVPRGFAHGFLVLEDETIFNYKCDNYYNKQSEAGIIFNDQELKIDWKLSNTSPILSDKDLILPKFKNAML